MLIQCTGSIGVGRHAAQHGSHFHLARRSANQPHLVPISVFMQQYGSTSGAEEELPPLLARSFTHSVVSRTIGTPIGLVVAVATMCENSGPPPISAMKPKPTFCGLSLIQAAQMTPCSWTKTNNFPSEMPEQAVSAAPCLAGRSPV